MIDPKELRLLNLVNVKDLGYCKVSSLRELNIHAHPINNEYNHHSGGPEDFEPIPLTPEILIACGFKKRTYNDEYLFEEHSQMWFKYYSHLGAWQLEVDTSYEGGYETDIATIKSLHQLQNLYYCLTGEELNYKPLKQ